jgi:hypothetical protein
MSYKAAFKTCVGWLFDPPTFSTQDEATRYALAMAHRHMSILDFHVVPRKRPANSSFVR